MILGVAPRWVTVALALLVLAAVCPNQACGQANTTDAPTLIPTNNTAAVCVGNAGLPNGVTYYEPGTLQLCLNGGRCDPDTRACVCEFPYTGAFCEAPFGICCGPSSCDDPVELGRSFNCICDDMALLRDARCTSAAAKGVVVGLSFLTFVVVAIVICCCAICRRANTNAALAQGKVEYVDMSFSDYLKRDHSCIGCIYRPDSAPEFKCAARTMSLLIIIISTTLVTTFVVVLSPRTSGPVRSLFYRGSFSFVVSVLINLIGGSLIIRWGLKKKRPCCGCLSLRMLFYTLGWVWVVFTCPLTIKAIVDHGKQQMEFPWAPIRGSILNILINWLFTEVLIIYVRAKVLPDIVDRSERPDSEFDAVPVGSLYATEAPSEFATENAVFGLGSEFDDGMEPPAYTPVDTSPLRTRADSLAASAAAMSPLVTESPCASLYDDGEVEGDRHIVMPDLGLGNATTTSSSSSSDIGSSSELAVNEHAQGGGVAGSDGSLVGADAPTTDVAAGPAGGSGAADDDGAEADAGPTTEGGG